MPRYFFNRTDGHIEHDHDGTEFFDFETARTQAVMFAGECLKEDPKQIWEGQDFRLEVTDESGSLLFTVLTLAVDSPATMQNFKTR